MSVRDPWRGPKVLYGCKRPAVLSGKFCVGVRDPQCNLKVLLPKKDTHGYGYHIYFELCDKSRD